MRKTTLIIFSLLTLIVSAEGRTQILTHYMPWYQAPPTAFRWGWHWTMNHFNPDQTDAEGRRDIASHFYPQIGPYDSSDPYVLEYHVLLMKLSGIDGVIVDWYGMEDYADYGPINEATQDLFRWILKADLQFSFCYEDRTVENMVNGGYLSAGEALAHGLKVMDHIELRYLGSVNYVHLGDAPLLLVWGPVYFKDAADWETMLSSVNPRPLLYTYDSPLEPVAAGAYPWPPMHKSVGGVLRESDLTVYLTSFYQNARDQEYIMGTAFPGFKDIYEEAGLHDSYGYLDAKDGATFQLTLDRAAYFEADVLQLATWNDYGEGTIIEPTLEFGTKYLEMVQDFRKENVDSSFSIGPGSLNMPYRIFTLRKENSSDLNFQRELDRVFDLIIEEKLEDAERLLGDLENGDTGVTIHPEYIELSEAYPNPFNPSVSLSLETDKPVEVRLNIFDLSGRLVASQEARRYQSGLNHLSWTPSPYISTGFYFMRIEAGDRLLYRPVIYLK